MGLQKREEGKGGGVVYADVKFNTGVIAVTTGKDADGKAIKENYESVSGMITDLDIKATEYEGDTITNLRIKLEEAGEKPVIASFSLGSFSAAKVVGLLNAADLNKAFKLNVGMMKAGTVMRDKSSLAKDTVYVTAFQGDTRLVPVYSNGKTELPQPNEVMVSGKKVKDMAPVNAEVETVVKALFARMDALQQAGQVQHDEGVDLSEAQGAAAAAGVPDRASMAPRG